jgi:uncharacterized protein (TIGR02453 family)
MKNKFLLDEEVFPPFEGFPEEGIDFLKRLKKNNNREWFAKRKSEYEDFVKLPMQSLITSLKAPMAKLMPEIDVNPKQSMFRIYRDTRFSKNKTPYKTHVAAVFHLRGHWQDSAGFYVHIEPGNIYVGGGIYMPNSQQLKLIRQTIAERTKEFRSIVEDNTFKKTFKTLEGDKLQRAPLGYPIDHPMIEWLRFKSYYTGVEWKEKECYSPKFLDKIVSIYRDMLPLIRFLNEALGKG